MVQKKDAAASLPLVASVLEIFEALKLPPLQKLKQRCSQSNQMAKMMILLKRLKTCKTLGLLQNIPASKPLE